MSDFNFLPIACKSCQRTIWSGLTSTGIPTKLDTARLNLAQEVVKKIEGVRTYQIHKTVISFEATPRLGARLGGGGAVVLATHICSWVDFNYGIAPDYFKPIEVEKSEVSF